jgi:hypothetical protein
MTTKTLPQKPRRAQKRPSGQRQKPETKPPAPERGARLVDVIRLEETRQRQAFREADAQTERARTTFTMEAIKRSGVDFRKTPVSLQVAEAAMLRGPKYGNVGSRHDIWTAGDALAASLTGSKVPPEGATLKKAALLQIHSELRALATVLLSRHVDNFETVDLGDVSAALRGIAGRAKAAADFGDRYDHANREVTP